MDDISWKIVVGKSTLAECSCELKIHNNDLQFLVHVIDATDNVRIAKYGVFQNDNSRK